MKIIKTVTQKDAWSVNEITPESEYIEPREAVRVVIFDENNNVAINNTPSENGEPFYSMIGGGIDEGESILDALHREASEEAGCNLTNIIELGIVEERGIGSERSGFRIQTNYCFVADVLGDTFEPRYTDDDIKDGLQLVWLPIDEAISKLEKQINTFIKIKAVFLLREAKKLKGL